MELFQILTVTLLVVIFVEVTYLLAGLSKRFFRRQRTGSVLLDTSVLIDGRIISIAKLGFIPGELIVLRSVLGELQYLADGADHDKREKARHGLDIVSELKSIPDVEVTIMQDGVRADEGVDNRLIKLAKESGAAICTLDYNLNKVAVAEGVSVLNINELAQSLRMAYLPGEKMHIDLIQKGQGDNQAVGYLADGTMVVVERAGQMIGKNVEVEVVRSLQTAAGRMMFAKQLPVASSVKKTKSNSSNSTTTKSTGRKPVSKRASQTSKSKSRSVKRRDPEAELIKLANKSNS